MRLNREKVVVILASVILLAGLYQSMVGVVTPRGDIRTQDISLPPSQRVVSKPEFRRYDFESLPDRDPFRFSEGWRRLNTLPLEPPPLTDVSRLLPLPASMSRPQETGFFYLEVAPDEVGRKPGSTTTTKPPAKRPAVPTTPGSPSNQTGDRRL